MGSLATHDSIIPKRMDQWDELDNDVVAEPHRRFWGVSMQDEETKWRATQSENETMGVDELAEEDEDKGDETGAGCYVLTLGIPDLECQKLWIRKDYIRLYDFYQKYQESCRKKAGGSLTCHHRTTRHCCKGKATGSIMPCVGVSEKNPVIWYREGTLFLFVEGVCQVPEHFRSSGLKTIVWTLVDSDESSRGVPPYLAVRGTKHFIISSTSPQSSR